MAERLKAPVSKTGWGEIPSQVQILYPPPLRNYNFFFFAAIIFSMANNISEIKNENEITWRIEEPDLMPKTSNWFWAFGILAFALVVFSILLKNYLLIIIVALASFIIYGGKNKKLDFVNFHLDSHGLYIERKFYPYENFESFWIFPEQLNNSDKEVRAETREMILRYKKHVMPLLLVPIFSNDETQIRRILKKYLAEVEEQESLLNLLRKKFF